MRSLITHLRDAKEYEDNEDNPGKHPARSLVLANRSTDVAAQNRAAKTKGGGEHQPKCGYLVTVGLKDTFDTKRDIGASKGGKEKDEDHGISDDHSHNGS